MTIPERNKLAAKVFKKIMRKISQSRWDVLPLENAHGLPGEASSPNEYEPGSLSIGYFHQYQKGKVAEYREVFVAARVSEEDPAYFLYTFKHHPGSFNPRDGGHPPETEEVELGCYGRLQDLLRRVIELWVEEMVNGYFENAEEEEMAKHDKEN